MLAIPSTLRALCPCPSGTVRSLACREHTPAPVGRAYPVQAARVPLRVVAALAVNTRPAPAPVAPAPRWEASPLGDVVTRVASDPITLLIAADWLRRTGVADGSLTTGHGLPDPMFVTLVNNAYRDMGGDGAGTLPTLAVPRAVLRILAHARTPALATA